MSDVDSVIQDSVVTGDVHVGDVHHNGKILTVMVKIHMLINQQW